MTTYFILIILIVIAAILMVGIVLIQESKGGGLASNFASYNQIGGVRKTTDFIEKATWCLAAFMVIISIGCAWVAPKGNDSTNVIDQIELNTATSPVNANGLEASPVEEEAPAATTPEATEKTSANE
jgi:preprotein translocase subunit SecG